MEAELNRGEGLREVGVWPLCYPELYLCLIVCLFSHCRNQFAIGTVEQREKEACQVGHIQREMKDRQDRHKWAAGGSSPV